MGSSIAVASSSPSLLRGLKSLRLPRLRRREIERRPSSALDRDSAVVRDLPSNCRMILAANAVTAPSLHTPGVTIISNSRLCNNEPHAARSRLACSNVVDPTRAVKISSNAENAWSIKPLCDMAPVAASAPDKPKTRATMCVALFGDRATRATRYRAALDIACNVHTSRSLAASHSSAHLAAAVAHRQDNVSLESAMSIAAGGPASSASPFSGREIDSVVSNANMSMASKG
mmetsp:Transcript_5303/g.19311  ORF Transcript_5303/g.19311 Transcript_5303/m.19311 type:complete len:231 (-) Transcript_5303:2170-2862(-)